MKRFAFALPVVAAVVLFCATAYASDAAILPEPLATHWLIGVMAIVIPAVRTALSNDTIKLPVWSANYRMLLVALLAGATIIVDGLANGFTFEMALASFLANGLPSLVQEIIKIVFGAGKPPSSGSGTGGTSMRPPPGYSTPMKAMVFAVALTAVGCLNCASWKNVPDKIHDVSSEVVADVQEAQQIVDVLHALATTFFLMHANAETQAKVEQGFAVVSLALNTAARAATGAKQATSNDYDVAFASFRAAYQNLVLLLKEVGVVKADEAKFGAVRSSGALLEVPEPRAMRARQ